jgi:hypothetical protein
VNKTDCETNWPCPILLEELKKAITTSYDSRPPGGDSKSRPPDYEVFTNILRMVFFSKLDLSGHRSRCNCYIYERGSHAQEPIGRGRDLMPISSALKMLVVSRKLQCPSTKLFGVTSKTINSWLNRTRIPNITSYCTYISWYGFLQCRLEANFGCSYAFLFATHVEVKVSRSCRCCGNYTLEPTTCRGKKTEFRVQGTPVFMPPGIQFPTVKLSKKVK